MQAPRIVQSDAPLDLFSSGRAMKKLEVIAKEPHPVGSQAHHEVRDYLILELEGLGLKPEIQKAVVESSLTGEIENIITRMPGTASSKAVMIAAHYDSETNTPGAADDGAGIAAMLETIRALKAAGPLKNDVIFLMTDGEETGLYGAKAFMEDHAWAHDVGIVLNFEARGNKGPSFMFETSDQNGWLIKEFIKAAPDPVAYSIIYNLYKLMPNDTDLTVFREEGLSGLNFAFGMGLNAYHQPIDTPENLDMALYLPGGSYLTLWPLLSSLIGLNFSIRMRSDERKWGSVFFAMPGLLLFAPICYLIYVLMTLQLAAALLSVVALGFTLIYPVFCTRSSHQHSITK